MQSETAEAKRARLVRRLGVVANDAWPYRIRLSAVRAIQAMLPERNPLRYRPAEDLLESVKRPWDTKPVLSGGRAIEGLVVRPPQGLSDVW